LIRREGRGTFGRMEGRDIGEEGDEKQRGKSHTFLSLLSITCTTIPLRLEKNKS